MVSMKFPLQFIIIYTFLFIKIIETSRNNRKKLEMENFSNDLEKLRLTQEELLKGLFTLHQDVNYIKKATENNLPMDCNSARIRGDWRSVIAITPPELNSREVRCDQVTSGGGWTVLLRRASKYKYSYLKSDSAPLRSKFTQRGLQNEIFIQTSELENLHENFNRSWEDYKMGFGKPRDEYWIGNEVIHALTREGLWEAAVLLHRWDGRKAAAYWDSFRVGEEKENFRLWISGYRGDKSEIGDGLSYHTGMFFSTEDADNDDNSIHCAKVYGGGWWFNQCHVVHLTGSHLEPGSDGEHALHWLPWNGDKQTLKAATLMIRPKLHK